MRTRGRDRGSLREEEETAARHVGGLQEIVPETQAGEMGHNGAEDPTARYQAPGPSRDRQERMEVMIQSLHATVAQLVLGMQSLARGQAQNQEEMEPVEAEGSGRRRRRLGKEPESYDQSSRAGGNQEEEEADEERRHPRARRMRSEVRQEPRIEEEEEDDSPDIEERDAYIYSRGTEPSVEETTLRSRSSRSSRGKSSSRE